MSNLYAEQTSKIWRKNIRAFLRNRGFYVGRLAVNLFFFLLCYHNYGDWRIKMYILTPPVGGHQKPV